MCPPVSPCKGASIVKFPRMMRMSLVWKRRCADVRAGTQAPPLPFQHLSPFRKWQNKEFGACGASANGKTRNSALAELPQMVKQEIRRLRSFRKWRNRKFEACGASANGKTENLVLAELPQMAKQKNWCLRSFRKWRNKKFGACGASANGKTRNLVLAELPQAFLKRE